MFSSDLISNRVFFSCFRDQGISLNTSSSANEIVEVNIGLRPISELIHEKQIQYYLRINDEDYQGGKLTKVAMDYSIQNKNSYAMRMETLLTKYKVGKDIKKSFRVYARNRLLTEIGRKQSLGGITAPPVTRL